MNATLAAVLYLVSGVLFILALRGLGTARTGAYFSFAPFIGALLGIILWHDPVTPILMAAIKRHEPSPIPSDVELV